MQRVDGEERERGVVDGEDQKLSGGSHVRIAGAVILLVAGVAVLPFARASGTATYLIVYALSTALWGIVLAVARSARLSIVIGIAVLVRIPLALHPPLLSPDLYRYLWDGRVSISGVNPYAYPPDAPALDPLRDANFERVEHRDIRSVYPPYAQGLFALWAAAGGHLLTWRVGLLLAELATVVVLARFSRRGALSYAACPLAAAEGFWNGHLDVVAGALFLGSVVAKRATVAGALLGVAAGTKVLPAAALPMFRRQPLAFAFFLSVFLIPVLAFAAVGPVMSGMVDFGTRWSFNAPVFEIVRSAVVSLRLDEIARRSLTVSKSWLPLEPVSGLLYRQFYPDFLARGVLAVIFVAALTILVRLTPSRFQLAARSTALLLILSPTIHPWYWLTILPVAVAARERHLIALAIASPISYLLYEHFAIWAVYATAYVLPLAAASLQVSSGLRERDISRWIAFRGDSLS